MPNDKGLGVVSDDSIEFRSNAVNIFCHLMRYLTLSTIYNKESVINRKRSMEQLHIC